MADTIVTNSPGQSDSNAVGMVIAFIILLAVIVGGIVLFRNGAFNNQAAQPDTNINVTIPTPNGWKRRSGSIGARVFRSASKPAFPGGLRLWQPRLSPRDVHALVSVATAHYTTNRSAMTTRNKRPFSGRQIGRREARRLRREVYGEMI